MKIFCIGMNYPSCREEGCGAACRPEEPVVFLKADSALLKGGRPFFVPDFMGRIDYSAELVVRVSRLGKGIPERFAPRYYDAVTVGVDFTAGEMLERARREGLPWDVCKGFDGSAAIGEWIDREEFAEIGDIGFRLDVNGRTVQCGRSGDMLFSVNRIISHLSRFHTLKTGDIIFTGAPQGVGTARIDDHIDGFLGGRKVLSFNCK